jgi:hypothetical protein
MVTEDYVSFEIAKLLKEKGFDEECRAIYEEGILRINTLCEYHNSELSSYVCVPTLQMTLKWLREIYNIYIDILTYTTGKNIQFRWVGYEKGRLFSQEEGKTIYFDSYEQTIEAALLYVLKNLI